MGVHCLYGRRHCDLQRLGAEGACRLGELRAAGPARLAPAHRSVLVRAAVCHQVAPAKGMKMKSQPRASGKAASKLVSERIAGLGDWRGDALARMRALIREADPDVVEEWKWMGTPVWSHDGGVCTGESYKSVVKLTFFKGASLKDPAKLFNSSLDGNVRRAIDIHEGEEIDANAFKALVRQAIALNSAGKSKPSKKAKS